MPKRYHLPDSSQEESHLRATRPARKEKTTPSRPDIMAAWRSSGVPAKPAASRLIPVTVFINGELEDGAIFQPRPIPFALTPGNAYELQRAGVPQGLLELSSASKQPDADTGTVDGWWGYGSVQPQAVVKESRLRASRSLSPITTASDDGKSAPGNKTADGKAGDPDRNSDASSADPDRPTLRRRSTTGASKTPAASTPTTDPSATPPDDPDRPTLKRHEPAATISGTNAPAQHNGDLTPEREVATDALNNDPNRPVLHRGVPTGPGNADPDTYTTDPKTLAKLAGLPEDLHQMVAVSDPANRPEHDFARPWTDDAEHKAILATLEAMARVKLAAYSNTGPRPESAVRSGRLVGQATGDGTPVGPTGGPTFNPANGSVTGSTAAARHLQSRKAGDHYTRGTPTCCCACLCEKEESRCFARYSASRRRPARIHA